MFIRTADQFDHALKTIKKTLKLFNHNNLNNFLERGEVNKEKTIYNINPKFFEINYGDEYYTELFREYEIYKNYLIPLIINKKKIALKILKTHEDIFRNEYYDNKEDLGMSAYEFLTDKLAEEGVSFRAPISRYRTDYFSFLYEPLIGSK